MAYDLRGHGDSDGPAGTAPYAWEEFGHDFRSVLHWTEQRFGRPVHLCATHSFSGDCALMACAQSPLPLRRLVLLDPVLADDEGARIGGPALAEGTLRLGQKEMDGFTSRDAAADWVEKTLRRQLFRSALDPRAKRAFETWGVQEESNGRYRLKCRRETEAEIYRNRLAIGPHLQNLPEVEVDVDLVFARKRRGKDETQSAAFSRDWQQAQLVLDRCPRGRSQILENVGHFLVLEDPDVVAELLAAMLA